MATIARGSKASGGTTFLDGTTAYGSEVETDFSTVYTAWNNTDAGTSKWTVVSALNASSTVIIADNSSGSNNVFEGRVNGVAKVTIGATGILTTAATIAMSSQKITGLANGTAASDAAAFGQIFTGFQASVTAVSGSAASTSTTSSTYQNTALTAAITPTSASHRIKVTVSSSIYNDASLSTIARVSLKRGSTELSSNGNGFAVFGGNATARIYVPLAFTYIDSPATTSSTTYTVVLKSSDNTTNVSFGTSQDSIITLEEIV